MTRLGTYLAGIPNQMQNIYFSVSCFGRERLSIWNGGGLTLFLLWLRHIFVQGAMITGVI